MRNAYFAYLLLALALAGSSVAGINPRASGLSTADQAKLDAMTESGGNITFTGDVTVATGQKLIADKAEHTDGASPVEFQHGYSVASGPVTTSGATVMPNGFGMLDPNGDGASVDTSDGKWRNVIAGVVDGKLYLDWDHYRTGAGHLIASQEIRCSNDGACTVGSSSGSVKALYLKEQSSAPAATSGDAAIYAKTDDTLRANDSTGNDLTLTLSGPPNWTP